MLPIRPSVPQVVPRFPRSVYIVVIVLLLLLLSLLVVVVVVRTRLDLPRSFVRVCSSYAHWIAGDIANTCERTHHLVEMLFVDRKRTDRMTLRSRCVRDLFDIDDRMSNSSRRAVTTRKANKTADRADRCVWWNPVYIIYKRRGASLCTGAYSPLVYWFRVQRFKPDDSLRITKSTKMIYVNPVPRTPRPLDDLVRVLPLQL